MPFWIWILVLQLKLEAIHLSKQNFWWWILSRYWSPKFGIAWLLLNLPFNPQQCLHQDCKKLSIFQYFCYLHFELLQNLQQLHFRLIRLHQKYSLYGRKSPICLFETTLTIHSTKAIPNFQLSVHLSSFCHLRSIIEWFLIYYVGYPLFLLYNENGKNGNLICN